jgi:hypothetical protein
MGMIRGTIDNERLKKQLERDHADILALQQRIKNFAQFDTRREARRDDVALMLPPPPPVQKAG